MPQIPDLAVKKQLKVGIAVPPAANLIGISGGGIRGSAFIEGPLDVGTPIFAPGESNVCISRCINPDAIPPPISLVKIRNNPLTPPLPTDVIIGDLAGPVGVTVFCRESTFFVQAATITLLNAAYANTSVVKNDIASLYTDISNKVFALFKAEIGVNKNVALDLKDSPVIGAAPFVAPDFQSSTTTLNGTFALAVQNALTKKGFDIPHPTKKNHRLRHICLEGPDAEVFYRGRMENTTTINLPDYWRDLVDPDSIGVHLTPMGSYQELFVENIEWGTKVTVKNASGGPIKCSYVVFGLRTDGEKNIPEYEGLTTNDYPGDNSEYRLNDN
jgi:hypothetical protein